MAGSALGRACLLVLGISYLSDGAVRHEGLRVSPMCAETALITVQGVRYWNVVCFESPTFFLSFIFGVDSFHICCYGIPMVDDERKGWGGMKLRL